MGKYIRLSVAILCLVICTSPVHAALINRGTGMIYDTDLGITWLQDAYYAGTDLSDAKINEIISSVGSVDGHTLNTSDFSDDYVGLMTWWGAVAWTDQLIYGGYDDWRLPNILPVNGTNYNFSELTSNGSTDYGYNISAPGSAYPGSKGSEMAYMYYNDLGNLRTDGTQNPPPGSGVGLVNTGDFNLRSTSFWSGLGSMPTSSAAMYFDFGNGVQSFENKDCNNNRWPGKYAWAVRDGDYGPSVSTDAEYVMNLTLGDTFSFDYFWLMGQEPTDLNFDIFAFRDNSWQLLGGDINFGGSSTEWQNQSLIVPENLRGLTTQIRFMVLDVDCDTDPTVYLRNIASNGTAPVPEPATMLLLGTGLFGLAGFRKKIK